MPCDALLDVPQRSNSLQAAGQLELLLPTSMRKPQNAGRQLWQTEQTSLDRERAFEGQRGSTSMRKMNWRLLCKIRRASLLLPALRHTPMLNAVSGASTSASPDTGLISTVLATCPVQGGGGPRYLRVVVIAMVGCHTAGCEFSDYLQNFELVRPSQMALQT